MPRRTRPACRPRERTGPIASVLCGYTCACSGASEVETMQAGRVVIAISLSWRRPSWYGLVAHNLDVVPVGIDHEGRVVVRVVVRAQARRAVVAGTGLQRRAMEGVD